MDVGALRPLDLGASLDAAIKICRARFRPLVTVVFVVTLPALVLTALVQLSAGSASSITKTDPQTNLPTFDGKAFGIYLAGVAVVLVLTVVSSALATAGAFRIISGVYLGDEPTWQDSLRFAWHRLGSVLWVTVLVLLASLVGLLVFLVGYAWVRTAFAFAVPVLLVEGLRGTEALGRSRRLVQGRFWPVLGTLFIAFLLASAVQGAISAPAIILTFTSPGSAAGAVVQFVTALVGTAIVTPFTAAVVVVVYFDLRVRKEGFDLVLLAQRVGVEPAPDGFPAQPGAPRFPTPAPWADPWGTPRGQPGTEQSPPGWGQTSPGQPPPGWGQSPPGWSQPGPPPPPPPPPSPAAGSVPPRGPAAGTDAPPPPSYR